MTSLILQPTITADWHKLVREAEAMSHLCLNDNLESYLIFLLSRFTRDTAIVSSVLSTEYLNGMQALGVKQVQILREVGDKCLLFAGLFPERAEHKRVKVSYFVELGQGAYSQIAAISKVQQAVLYEALSAGFVLLMDVLHALREYSSNDGLQLVDAMELWQDTGSGYALKMLRRSTQALPISGKINNRQQ